MKVRKEKEGRKEKKRVKFSDLKLRCSINFFFNLI